MLTCGNRHPDVLFASAKGVYRTRVGYTGGKLANPTYHRLGDHTESVQIEFNPAKVLLARMGDIFSPSQITFTELLQIFWSRAAAPP